MNKPFELIKDKTIQFLFLFTNADGFYISARHNLQYGWIAVGCTNAQQSIELYIKAILKLKYTEEWGHDIIKILNKYKSKENYFSEILNDKQKVGFLSELSDAYLSYRYGETGSKSNSKEMIEVLDELVFNLRNIYIKNIRIPSGKIYIPNDLRDKFLESNKFFTDEYITNNQIAQMMPDVGLPDFDFITRPE